jgi:hypothetical protein
MAPPVVNIISPPNGRSFGGDAVQIYGSGFGSGLEPPAPTVTFNSNIPVASSLVVNDGLISIITPPAPNPMSTNSQPVYVEVHTQGGSSFGSNPKGQNYNPLFIYDYIVGVPTVTIDTTYLWAGSTSTVTVMLDGPALLGPVTVEIGLIGSGVTLSGIPITPPGGVPSIIIPVNENSGTFQITTSASAEGIATIQATATQVSGGDGTMQFFEVPVYTGEIQVFVSIPNPPLLVGETAIGTVIVQTPGVGGNITLTTNQPTNINIPNKIPLTGAAPPASSMATFGVTAVGKTTNNLGAVGGITVTAKYLGNSGTSEPFSILRKSLAPRLPNPV